MIEAPGVERKQFRVTGTVQGVGFRPFVYRLATELGLTGFVCNDSAGVLLEVEGPPAPVAELVRRMTAEAPPLARVAGVKAVPLAATGASADRFVILESGTEGPADVPVSIDTATCSDCLAEVDNRADRRYGYPFTNCTNCGPRYTIVRSVPYDRPATTMVGFEMCTDCRREYEDPGDRRFHAQPNACPRCGPQLRYCKPDREVLAEGESALAEAAAGLRSGRILAIKGIGGFHIAADATNTMTVEELRRRKARDDKPFAVMVPDLMSARALCWLDGAAETALVCPRRPIVLAPRRPDPDLAPAIAPRLGELGLFLPYSALHHLLIRSVGRPLVLTSGNLSDEPIAHEDADAFARLGSIVDAVLTHDRAIHIRCDDSVVRATGGGNCRVQAVRRSRGYAPEPLPLPAPAGRQVLALGAELKNTVAVAKGGAVVASHHIGDLEHLAAHRSFHQAVTHVCHLYGVAPEVVAHDLHPEYLSTKSALELDLPTLAIQHHHAHVASCLLEHRHMAPVLGIAFDGLGFGVDGTLWGGEFLVADFFGFERVGHLRHVPMPGGAAAIREPWRMAVAWVQAAAGSEVAERLGSRHDDRAAAVVRLVQTVDLGASRACPLTTSMGRLFDAVAALAGVRGRISYEGQAAIELEALARTVSRCPEAAYPVDLSWVDGRLVLDPIETIDAVRRDVDDGQAPPVVAARFHEAIGGSTVAGAIELASRHGLDTVALTGGVFQNARLTDIVESGLKAEGLTVLTHAQVPPNDGGISLGQAAIAALAEEPSS